MGKEGAAPVATPYQPSLQKMKKEEIRLGGLLPKPGMDRLSDFFDGFAFNVKLSDPPGLFLTDSSPSGMIIHVATEQALMIEGRLVAIAVAVKLVHDLGKPAGHGVGQFGGA